MKRAMLAFAIVPLLSAGCSTPQMWDHGFSTVSDPAKADKQPGYRPPIATKDKNGGIVVEYDVVRYHLGIFGGEPASSKWRLQRVTNTAPIDLLQPASHIGIGNNPWSICPPARDERDFASSGDTLPVRQAERTEVGNRNGEVYPGSECLLDNRGQWIWYVPPRYVGDSPQVAVLSKLSVQKSPGYIPVKLIMTPVTILGDAIIMITLPITLPIALHDVH